MKPWNVFLKFDNSNSEKKLELFDAKSYFGGYLKIKRSYFNKLIKIIKMTKTYSTGRAIEKVISPDEVDWTFNPWMLLLIKDNEKEKNFWFFIKREKDLSGLLVAIGPKPFVEYNKVNSEAKREIKQIINYIVAYFNKFQVIILLPKNLN
ncbi:MAG: hypothetical protein EU535_04080 [Promethearchaeota archaeon]|nr:MAG: hypothetical protein EU535_04080 [Candidatus Lokiarchaeota archaeon]